MAVDLKGLMLGGMQAWSAGSAGYASLALDSTTDKIHWIVMPPRQQSITHVHVRYSSRTGTPPTYRLSLQSVGADGRPSGTILGGASPASVSVTPPADTSWDGLQQRIALDNAYTVTSSDTLIAVVLEYSSGTVNGSNNSSWTYAQNGLASALHGVPNTAVDVGAGWVKVSTNPIIALEYASGLMNGTIVTGSSIASNLTIDGNRSALKFTLDSSLGSAFVLKGIELEINMLALGQSITFGIWDGAGTALASVTLDTDVFPAASGQRYCKIPFQSPPTLSFGTPYYAGLERAGANCGINYYALLSSASLTAFPGGSEWHLSTWDGASWTDDETKRPIVNLEFDTFTPGASGGGIVLGAFEGGAWR